MSGGGRRGRGARGPDVDAAVRRARQVVGLYGDPGVSWSVVLRVGLAVPVTAVDLATAWRELTRSHPGLGRVGPIVSYDDARRAGVLAGFADTVYDDHDPLLRVALAADGHEVVVSAHHGAADGLGLLGAAGALTGVDLASSARGVAPGADDTSFLLGSLHRLREAALSPPLRLTAHPARWGTGDLLTSRDVADARGGTAALVLAAARATRAWNDDPPAGAVASGRRLVVALGLSRRPGTPMAAPDRDTAYARLDVHGVTDLAGTRELVGSLRPEPAFPVTEGFGIGPRVTRLLAPLLGSTVLVSNLGLVATPAVRRLEFWPVPAGPAGVCLGLASTRDASTVTVRARRPWFAGGEAERLAGLVVDALEPPQ